ncbi:hypothetical protein RCH10_005524 [Variovorax sp. GrIS 2.14]|uniref:hypothetical protein n=1 Tax=Variovorax sp. GrIS 2.14 TaxID=3071709 RepID=UPI0038F62F50
MPTSTLAAQVVVRAYLDGLQMDEYLFAAAVWMAEACLGIGLTPTLSEMLRRDIDSQVEVVSA